MEGPKDYQSPPQLEKAVLAASRNNATDRCGVPDRVAVLFEEPRPHVFRKLVRTFDEALLDSAMWCC